MTERIQNKLFFILFCLLALPACEQEFLAPEQQISGCYALDSGTGLTDQYLKFDGGILSVFTSSTRFPLAENCIWSNGKGDYTRQSNTKYFIQDGFIHLEAETSLIAQDSFGKMTIGDKTYMRLDGFRVEPYSVICPERASYEIPLQGGDFSIPVTVTNPIPAGELTAKIDSDWISGLLFNDGYVSFHAAATNSPRSGTIDLEYTQAEDVLITIHQNTFTYIRLQEQERTIGYQSSEIRIPYSIDNPIQGSVLSVSATEDWVHSISVQSNRVTVNVSDNYSGFSRSATLLFSYLGAEDVAYLLIQDSQAITSLSLNKTALNLYCGESASLKATVVPSNAQPKWKSSNSNVATVTQTGTVTAVEPGKATITVYCGDKSQTCTVIVSSPCPPGAVDLGITTANGNRLYWATCNLSETGFVNTPEAFGDYYAWGETSTKSYYSWSNYKWCNGSSNTLTKYNTNESYGIVDNKVELENGPDGDDVASRKLGGLWRIPTTQEWEELQTKCIWEPLRQNGHVGFLIRGTNGNSIFIPSAYIVTPGNWGARVSYGYWSSSLYTAQPSLVKYLNISGGYFNDLDDVSARFYTDSRMEGHYIRPVSE